MAQYQPMYDSFNRMPERYVPTARMGVSANVFLPGSEVDFTTGQLKSEHERRHRTQAQKLEREKIERMEAKRIQRRAQKEENRNLQRAVLLFVGLCFVLGIVTLSKLGQIGNWQDEINKQEKIIAEYMRANLILEEELALASDPAVICYAASRELNMIPAESAKAIELTAVDTRPLETVKRQRQLANANAQAEQVQNTPVPMTASN